MTRKSVKKTTGSEKNHAHIHLDNKSKNVSGVSHETSSSPEADIQSDKERTVSVSGQNDQSELIHELGRKLEDMLAEAKEWQDKYMRLSAEFDNYRKRTLKEKAEITKLANADLLKDILPVVDDFERGRNTLAQAVDLDSFRLGIDLIYNKFVEFLRQNGISEIDARNQAFDLDFHEALTKIPAPTEDEKGKVIDVIEKGYLLNERVIRYAKVVVGE